MIRSDDSLEILDPDIHDDYWLVMDNEPDCYDAPEPPERTIPDGQCAFFKNIAAVHKRTSQIVATAEIRCFNEAAEFTIIVDNATGAATFLPTCGNH